MVVTQKKAILVISGHLCESQVGHCEKFAHSYNAEAWGLQTKPNWWLLGCGAEFSNGESWPPKLGRNLVKDPWWSTLHWLVKCMP